MSFADEIAGRFGGWGGILRIDAPLPSKKDGAAAKADSPKGGDAAPRPKTDDKGKEGNK
jgi:hypothetical protein